MNVLRTEQIQQIVQQEKPTTICNIHNKVEACM